MCNGHVTQDRLIWKLKLPLKIKIFCWYLRKGVILTKDNLARRNWNGDKKCVYCTHSETIQHLFFDCHFTKFIWRAIYFSFGITMPSNVNHMFHGWLQGMNPTIKTKILVGAIAMCWSLWISQNDVVFISVH